MKTTTIRVDAETHRRIQRLHDVTGKPMIDVVRDAVDALDRVRFAAQITSDLDALRAKPEEWASYLDEAEALPVGDGLT